MQGHFHIRILFLFTGYAFFIPSSSSSWDNSTAVTVQSCVAYSTRTFPFLLAHHSSVVQADRQYIVVGVRSAECNFFPQCTEINLCFTSHTCTIIIIIVMVNGATRKTNGWQWRPCCPWYWSFFIILVVVVSHRNHPFTGFSSRPVPAHRLSGRSSGRRGEPTQRMQRKLRGRSD